MIKEKLADILFPFLYVYDKCSSIVHPVRCLSAEETIRLVKNGYSVARFGDGEINICLKAGYNIDFQEWDPELADELNKILSINMSADENKGFLVAILPVFTSLQGYDYAQKRFYAAFNFRRRKWLLDHIFCKGSGQIFGDAFFARPWGYKKDTGETLYDRIERLNSIWKNKSVLIIEGKSVQLGVGTDMMHSAAKVQRIIIPDQHAFIYRNQITGAVKRQKGFEMILIVAGPTATVLAYDLFQMGYHAVDFGQGEKAYASIAPMFRGYRHKVMTKEEYLEQIADTVL